MKLLRKVPSTRPYSKWRLQYEGIHISSRFASSGPRARMICTSRVTIPTTNHRPVSSNRSFGCTYPLIQMASFSWLDSPRTPPNEGKSSPKLDSRPMSLASFPAENSEKLLTRRIHILGTGSIGTLVAHSLKILPNPPPISIILHRPEIFDDFKNNGRIVRLVNKKTDIVDDQTGYDLDLITNVEDRIFWKFLPHKIQVSPFTRVNEVTEGEKLSNDEIFIYSLIVTVKGPATVTALTSVKHRIDERTTILLMQNGMGQIDELNEKVFTDPKKRPTYMLGIISHGAYMSGPFTVVHAGHGSIALGIHRDTDNYPIPPPGTDIDVARLSDADRKSLFPSDEDLYSSLSSRYLLRTLTRSPVLSCAAYPCLDLFQLQLEKLVTNCIINPLTALLDVTNGVMLENSPLTRVQRLLIAEISLVIRGMPELRGIPNANMRFSAKRLEQLFRGMARKTAQNSSSMREDIRHVKLLEIDYINGYIVKRGEEQGIQCVLNYMLMQLLKAKSYHDMNSAQTNVLYDTSGVEAQIEKEGQTVTLEDKSTPYKPFRWPNLQKKSGIK